MKTKDLRSIVILMGLALALFAAGCGEPEPCNTDPAQIEALRAELTAAEQQAGSSSAEVARVEERQAELAANQESLPDQAELEARLEVLKKGSGR